MPEKAKTFRQALKELGQEQQEQPRSSCRSGYGYRHQQFRLRLLKRRKREAVESDMSPCHDCANEGRKYEVHSRPLHLHHLEKVSLRPDLQFVPTNCVFLCHRHHSLRTARGE